MKRVLFIAAALSGCASNNMMDGVMRSWIGAPVEEARVQWGYPTTRNEFQGRTVYIWSHSRNVVIPATTTTQGTVVGRQVYSTSTTYGGQSIHAECTRILEVDASGTVVGTDWQGQCPRIAIGPAHGWRRKSNP